MKCPYCGYSESKVIDSRPADDGASIRRRRECLSCAKRFTTYETVESLPMVVVKKDGSRQSFDRSKVLGGMIRACEKRPVPLAELERIADSVEQELQNGLDRKEAMVKAATSSDHSIITGGLVLFCACLSVSLISHIDLVAALCTMLARGALISVVVCLFLMPSILMVCEPLIARTTKGWRTPLMKRAAKGTAPIEERSNAE